MADKKYTKLPVVHQTPVIKNFFDTTVEQLFSKSNIENISAYVGNKNYDVFEPTDRYIVEPTPDREKYSLEPVVNSIDQETGRSVNKVFYEDFLNILKSYGVNVKNQNSLFDTDFYSFLPPINIDKFVNYQEYFWSPQGPTPIIVEGTADHPINIEKDILGKISYTTPSGIEFKNGMVISFFGDYVIPNTFKGEKRFIVEGVGESILLFDKEQNFATPFSTEDFIPYDQTIIDTTDDLIVASTNYLSGGLIGVENYEYYADGTLFTYDGPTQLDASTGGEMWTGYVVSVGESLVYTVGGEGAYDANPFDSGNTQEVPDYILMQRGAKDNNVWSRINFWHHKENFLDAGDLLPGKQFRAQRPIIEFDRDIELYNFGKIGKFAVEISGFNTNLEEVAGRPTSSAVDNTTLAVGNQIIFPNEITDIGQYVYVINGETISTTSGNDINDVLVSSNAVDTTVISVNTSELSNITVNSVVIANSISSNSSITTVSVQSVDEANSVITVNSNVTLYNGDILTIYPNKSIFTLSEQNNDIYSGAKVSTEAQDAVVADKIVETASGSTITLNGDAIIPDGTLLEFTERVILKRKGDPDTNPAGLTDGDTGFVPYVATTGDVVSIKFGSRKQGREYYWDGVNWIEGQFKLSVNTPIKFQAYDTNKYALNNELVYPNNNFTGTKIFSYSETSNGTNDPVLGFPIEYRNFNNFSEIAFENNLETDLFSYVPFGGSDKNYVDGYLYYKKELANGDIVYSTAWESVSAKHRQRVEDQFIVSDDDLATSRNIWKISAIPQDIQNLNESIRVYINGVRTKEFSYDSNLIAITFVDYAFNKNDVIDVYTTTNTGYILSDDRLGRYSVPLSWHSNLNKSDIEKISQPEFLEHFRDYIQDQEDILGDPLGSNNFQSISKNVVWADKIVQTDDDLITAGFLFSNDKFNIKDALSFCSEEYSKYKNRLNKEISRYINQNDITGMSYGEILELVIENVITYNQGKNVFDNTYMIAFGDKNTTEKIVINNVLRKEYIISAYVDVNEVEKTVYVYDQNQDGINTLLIVDRDYTISSDSGILTITFTDTYNLQLGSVITVTIYDENRESAQVPPTPSAMGLYPLYMPEIFVDDSFREPITMIRGHDGSKTAAKLDVNDYVLLEFEKRIFNNTLQYYRDKTSQPDLNVTDIRPGRYRSTGLSRDDYYSLLRSNFNMFIARNELDFVKNEYFDLADSWTWNYNSGTEAPSYWRGFYECCYDTERPHTHPWEMLGFIKQPDWWTEEYGTDFGSTNNKLWEDLEQGIIRQGPRENLTNNRYRTNNHFRRIGLKYELPVDANANLLPPANIHSTVSTTKNTVWVNTETGNSTVISDTFIKTTNGLNVSIADDGNVVNVITNNIPNHVPGMFPNSDNDNELIQQELTYSIDVNTDVAQQVLDNNNVSVFENAVSTGNIAVGVAVNGVRILPANSGIEHSLTSSLHYNSLYRNEVGRDTFGGTVDTNGVYSYVQPSADVVGLSNWDETQHSPIIGWSFDGFPIYGPYGYEDRADVNSNIVRLESGYTLKTTIRSVVGGLPTGEFVEDYEFTGSQHGLDRFNGRYGPTPEFPNGTYYYVATITENNTPAYPYTVGSKFLYTTYQLAQNVVGSATTYDTDVVYNLNSIEQVNYSVDTETISSGWRFGDSAPAEYAWKISESYPFAVTEALLLSRPGKFATVFADPAKVTRSPANINQLIDKDTKKRIKVKNVKIHGNKTSTKNYVTTTGYTQFIDAFLKFQGLSTTTEFAKPFRSVNTKLGHKFAGYIDKDTMTVYSDSYSTTGNSSSLILPQEDIQVDIHVGPYSTTNAYTGVNIELTVDNKYKISGFSSITRYFEIELSNKNGPFTEVSVGGDPADFVVYDPGIDYLQSAIVKSGYNFYRAKAFTPAGTSVSNTQFWQRLPSLPTVNSAEATLYLQGTGEVSRVEYGVEYDNVSDVFDFLISLGRRQQALGFNFGEFRTDINDISNWAYSAKQFLFWSIGKWSSGNTLRLSPCATKLKFQANVGRVSAVLDVDQGQYSIVDEEGKVIRVTECEIIRDGNTIEIAPPEGKQIFGVILYTNEIEHSMLISNRTVFGDTVFNDVFNQRQSRLKIRGKRTKNWNGTLTAEGYLITEDGLKPNYDTLAADMGKYNEIGYVPVEKQLYELTRRQYGYQERKYLREFELVQDDQYDFYVGMIRSKGTKNSLEVLLNSDKVFIPGNVSIYDEWALKSGDFGDVDNYQNLDIKISKDEITDERQLIQIAYPEDTVSIVNRVEVLDPTTKFYQRPFLEIEPPPAEIPGSFVYGGGRTAQATVNINSDGTISDVLVTDPGYGYTINPAVTVVAAQLFTANITTSFLQPYAVSSEYVANNGIFTGSVSLSNVYITDNFANSSYANTVVVLDGVSNIEGVVEAFNNAVANIVLDSGNLDVSGNSNITTTYTRVPVEDIANSTVVENFIVEIVGNDFTLVDNANTLTNILKLDAKRYQPRQRYSFESANSTTYSDVIVKVDNETLTGDVVGATGDHDWEFDYGSRTLVKNNNPVLSGSASFTFVPTDSDGNDSDAISADNLTIINGTYPHIDVYINNRKLAEQSETILYSISSNVIANTSTITFLDVTQLPDGQLPGSANIEIVERSTIDFVDEYQGDLPGLTLNIKVLANDALAAKLEKIRTFEITPDIKSDSTILIDVDDSNRLVMRPTDMAEKNLWPTTGSVDYSGIKDSKYSPLPNAGYVSKYNVQYQTFDINKFEELFNRRSRPASKIPGRNDKIHFAKGEHEDFDVYNLTDINPGTSYIKFDNDIGTTRLFTDVSLNNIILDANDLSNVDAAYDETRWYDNVLVLKGRHYIDSYHGNIVLPDGEFAYDGTLLDINTPVVLFDNEELIQENAVEVGNISYTIPKVHEIDSIIPTVSGNITNVEPIVINNTNIVAAANIVTAPIEYSIFRNVSANTSVNLTYNGARVFEIYNGNLDQIKLGDYLYFEDIGGSNIHNNIFQVATLSGGTVSLYANASTLSGAPEVIEKANLSFVNYGNNKFGNDLNNVSSYSVQVYAKQHNLQDSTLVKFDTDTLGGSANTEFVISNVTTNTFTLDYAGNISANTIDDSGNLTLVESIVEIKVDYDQQVDNLYQDNFVTFTDVNSGALNGNTFQIYNVRTEDRIFLGNNTGELVNISAPIVQTVKSNTSSNTIILEEGDVNIRQGMYMFSTELSEPVVVKSVQLDNDRILTRYLTANVTTSNVLPVNKEIGSSIEIGDPVIIAGVFSENDGVTVTDIDDTTGNVTISESVTIEGDFVEVTFKHNGLDRLRSVTLESNVSLAQNDVVEFVVSDYNTDGLTETRTYTIFEIKSENVTSNVALGDLTFSVNDAIRFTTTADVTDVVLLDTVRIVGTDLYDGVYTVQSVDAGNSTIDVFGIYNGVRSVTETSANAVSSSDIIELTNNTLNVSRGMLVTSDDVASTIPAGTYVSDIISVNTIQVTNNVTLSQGANVILQDSVTANAAFMTNGITVTVKNDHSYLTDGTDSLIGKNIKIYDFGVNYYNWNWEVLDIPTANTIVLDGFGYDHPYTINGNTYISKSAYDQAGEDAITVDGNLGESITPFFIDAHQGVVKINEANVVVDAFPWWSVTEYANEINRQLQFKEGPVIRTGSFGLSFPLVPNGTTFNIPGLNIPGGIRLPPNVNVNIGGTNPPPATTPPSGTNVIPVVTIPVTPPAPPASTPPVSNPPNSGVPPQPAPAPVDPNTGVPPLTPTPSEQADMTALLRAATLLNQTVLPSLQTQTAPRAYKKVLSNTPGYSIGGQQQGVDQNGDPIIYSDTDPLFTTGGATGAASNSLGGLTSYPAGAGTTNIPTASSAAQAQQMLTYGGYSAVKYGASVYLSKNAGVMTSASSTSVGKTASTSTQMSKMVDLSQIQIIQKDVDCPPPPPPPVQPPPPPAQPNVETICRYITNKKSTGALESSRFLFTDRDDQTYSVTVLFNFHGAKDRMQIFQSTTSSSKGTMIASTATGVQNMSTQEKSVLSKARSDSYGVGTYAYTPKDWRSGGNGFVFDAGKLVFNYDPSKGRYITIDVQKGSSSIAIDYYICFPVNEGDAKLQPDNTNVRTTAISTKLGNQYSGTVVTGSQPSIGTSQIYAQTANTRFGNNGWNSYQGYTGVNTPYLNGTPAYNSVTSPRAAAGTSIPQNAGGVHTQTAPVLTIGVLQKTNSPSTTATPLATVATTNVDLSCPPKARVKVCGGYPAVGDGDTFYINGKSISLSANTSGDLTLAMVKSQIEAQAGDVVSVYIDTNANGEQCLTIENKPNFTDTLIIRNGCAGGQLKEVLDYALNREMDTAFSESTVTAGSVSKTSTVTRNVKNYAGNTIGSATTSSTGTDFITNTITAEQKRAANRPSTLSVKSHRGQGYRRGDILRVVGGVPARAIDYMRLPLASIKVVNPGTGYAPGGIDVIIRGGTGNGARANVKAITFDSNGGILNIPLSNPGENYDPTNPPEVVIKGRGQYARAIAVFGDTFTSQADKSPEVPAIFAVQDIDDRTGAITELKVIQRGIYTVFPSDLDQGVPLTYHTKTSGTADNDAAIPYTTKGSGEGARVFLTARALPDCGSPGRALQGLGLDPGITEPQSWNDWFKDLLNDYAPRDPNGFPYFTVDIKLSPSGVPELVFDGPNIDGIEFDDPFSPGLCDLLNIPKGAFINDPLPTVTVVDGSDSVDPNGILVGPPGSPGTPPPSDGLPPPPIGSFPPGVFPPGGSVPPGSIPPGSTVPPGSVPPGGSLPPGTVIPPPGYPPVSGTVSDLPPGIIDATLSDKERDRNGLIIDTNDSRGIGGPERGKAIRFDSPYPFSLTSEIGSKTVHGQIYTYTLSRLNGLDPVVMNESSTVVHVRPLALESLRYSTDNNVDLANIASAWVDNYQGTGKWAYLEGNTVIRKQENLVDTRFIRDVFTYDEISAEKEFDINLWDPFKGIIPGFIGKEIDYRSERDPVVYDTRKTRWGSTQVGRRWWNTSFVRYQWYEQGSGEYGLTGINNQERAVSWGEKMPGSEIVIYEWVESTVPPNQYTGPGRPITSGDYITESTNNPKTGKIQTKYYFWARGATEVSNLAKQNFMKERSVAELERILNNPDAERMAYAGIISPDAFVINNLGSLIKTEDSIVSINFKRKDTNASDKHTEWSLASEGDNTSTIPADLSLKLIDSLAGYNDLGEIVPSAGLSEFERFGSKFRPRQTMFKDINSARKQMFESLNNIFRELKMDSTFINWRDKLPSEVDYLETANWYEIQRINLIDNSTVYYDETFKPLRKVTDTNQFGLLQNVLDKSIIQVQKDEDSKFKLYEYNKATDEFKLIAMQNETVLWKESVYTDTQRPVLGNEIRSILKVLYEDVFVNTYETYWNKFFFDMLKYAYAEQGELDWAFKTTYLKIVKEETDLVPVKGFKVDNFDKAIDYFNEVKPYSSKIRNYSDIKKTPIEIIDGSITDFDRPPYYDGSIKEVRILDESESTDLLILNSDKQYEGFNTDPSSVRTFNSQIVFDRVKGSLYENTSGGVIETLIGDGVSNVFSFNIDIEDITKVQVYVNKMLVPETSTDNGNVVTNYTIDVDNTQLIFTNDVGVNNRIGVPSAGAKIEIKYIDGFNPTVEAINVSIAKNIVNIESNSVVNISNTEMKWTAPERLYKFDPDVRLAVTNAFELAYGAGAMSNTAIVQNVSIVTSMIDSGNLAVAFNLIKEKVGATFQGANIDSGTFYDIVPGQHPSYFYTDTLGWDIYSWDTDVWDKDVSVDNYVGIFNEETQGQVNFRVDDETYYGFDAVTFTKAKYGPDRPEELAVIEPLETLIIDVKTLGNTSISQNSDDVRYFMFMDLFGRTEYYRKTVDPLTTVTSIVNIWDTEISVENASILPEASQVDPGVVWINGERIEYQVRDLANNKLKRLIRGTRGTTVNTVLVIGAGIYNGEESENIRLRDGKGNLLRDPEDYNWIKPVEIYDNTVPMDDDWDLSGSITAVIPINGNANVSYANLTYDASNVVGYGLDSGWIEGSTSGTGINDYGSLTIYYDVDEDNGWDSGEKSFKEAVSLTDKGNVLVTQTSIIDFLHNFDE